MKKFLIVLSVSVLVLSACFSLIYVVWKCQSNFQIEEIIGE